ncbi:MAG TPA: hypothetical protein VHO03_02135 [Ignavibacteriales bacterium]|nr:hypothetical protein [Ignavibacteriales bacterium]
MLDKIVNIKNTLPYLKEKDVYNSLEKANLERILAGTVKTAQAGAKDSIRFSPAAHYLARINWRLKDLAIDQDGGKLFIALSAGGYDIHTELDFLNFHITARQFYEITSISPAGNKTALVRLRISAAKKSKFTQDEKIMAGFPGLDELIGRIYSLELTGEIDKYYSPALKELMDGIKETLIGEFDYINAALFTLVDRIAPGKMATNYVFNDENSEPIIIEKIKVLND